MLVDDYKTHFHTLSRHALTSSSTEAERIRKFVKGLSVSLQLATTQLVTLGVYF